MNIFEEYKDKIISIIKKAEKDKLLILPDNLNSVNVDSTPPKIDFDISTNVSMVLAKPNNKSPNDLALILIDLLKKEDKSIKEISFAKPGFINIKFNKDYWSNFSNKLIDSPNDYGSSNKNQKKYLVEYNLSEILFELNSEELLLDKYNLILNNINEKGFKNSANIFSISSTAKFGGDIGWISSNQLNEVFLKEIKLINTDEFTKPIQTSSGYLILKLNDKKETEAEVNFEKEFNKMVIEEKNRQLNQFSLIYFNKIKKNIFISEK